MLFRSILKTPSSYGILALLGAALLVASPDAEYLLRPLASHNGLNSRIVEMLLWLASATAFIIYAKWRTLPEDTVRRWLLLFAIFVLSLLPQSKWDHVVAATQLFALIGATLFVIGLLRYQPLHSVMAALDRLLSASQRLPSWVFIGIGYVVFLAGTVALSWYCFSFFPIYTDSEGQYIHAKYIAMGHLFWPANPYPKFFYLPMSVTDHYKW